MAATELLCHLLNIKPQHLSLHENLLLEAELFTRICEELKEVYKSKNKEYLSLIHVSIEKENTMLEVKFLRFVINDILITEEYSLFGIANYTQIPEEVLCDIALGKNKTPSLHASRRIIDLHRKVRPEIYKEVVKKIVAEYLLTLQPT